MNKLVSYGGLSVICVFAIYSTVDEMFNVGVIDNAARVMNVMVDVGPVTFASDSCAVSV
jgi:hypothetical protein